MPLASVGGFSRTSRQVGYIVAAGVNLVMLVVVQQILDWGVLPFLTQEFERVLPLISLSLGGTVLANLAYVVYDEVWFRSAVQIALGGIGLLVIARLLSVFPFDFTRYVGEWEVVARVVLVVAMIGVVVGIVVEAVRLAVWFLGAAVAEDSGTSGRSTATSRTG